MQKSFLISILSLTISFLSCTSAPPIKPTSNPPGNYSYTKKYINWLLSTQMKELSLVGISYALVDDQQIITSGGLGYADSEKRIPANGDTVYGIASVSKLFTALSVMQLHDQGRIDLDAPLKTYLPELQIRSRFPDSPPPTVRNTLSHHAGLPSDYLRGFIMESALDTQAYLQLPALLDEEYLTGPPGRFFSYSNLGFSLLGITVGRVGGMDFIDYQDKNVFGALGMGDSSFAPSPQLKSRMATGYMFGQEQKLTPIRDIPAGSAVSSVHDLSRFMRMIFADGMLEGRQVVSREALHEMLRPQNESVARDLDFRIGLPFWLGSDLLPGLRVKTASHGGDLPPYHAMLFVLPEHKLGVALLTNTGSSSMVLGWLAARMLTAALEAKTGARPKEQAATIAKLSAEQRNFQGLYAAPSFGLLQVESEEEYLRVRPHGSGLLQFDLRPRSDGFFQVQPELFGWFDIDLPESLQLKASLRSVGDERLAGVYINGTLVSVAQRLGFAEPATDVWRQRVGEYEIVNPEAKPFVEHFAIRYDEDVNRLIVDMGLRIAPGGVYSLPLNILSDTELLTAGIGRNAGETIRVVQKGGEELLHMSGYQFRQKL